jgi:imidazolonepropionase
MSAPGRAAYRWRGQHASLVKAAAPQAPLPHSKGIADPCSIVPVLRHIGTLAACCLSGGQDEIHTQHDAALVWEGPRIIWTGPDAGLPAQYYALKQMPEAEGRLVIPGLVDCHTHLAFAGWRVGEFAERILGRSYTEIAESGGGIVKTVAATRMASPEELLARCRSWLAGMAELGITTVEAKSGYGLTVESELKLLEVYRELCANQPVHIVSTLLAAHAVPPDYQRDRASYIALVTERVIPEVSRRGLARFCDVFIDKSAFSLDEAECILRAGLDNGLTSKVHADQLSDDGGAALAAQLQAASADHLDYISDEAITKLAASETVAVSLPLASLYLGSAPMPARKLIQAGVPVAVATDFNPGTAPSFHLPLAMLLACTLQRLTPRETLKGTTIFAAKAIGEEHRAGSLEPGKQADFAIIDAPDVDHWVYQFAANKCVATYIAGEKVWSRSGNSKLEGRQLCTTNQRDS